MAIDRTRSTSELAETLRATETKEQLGELVEVLGSRITSASLEDLQVIHGVLKDMRKRIRKEQRSHGASRTVGADLAHEQMSPNERFSTIYPLIDSVRTRINALMPVSAEPEAAVAAALTTAPTASNEAATAEETAPQEESHEGPARTIEEREHAFTEEVAAFNALITRRFTQREALEQAVHTWDAAEIVQAIRDTELPTEEEPEAIAARIIAAKDTLKASELAEELARIVPPHAWEADRIAQIQDAEKDMLLFVPSDRYPTRLCIHSKPARDLIMQTSNHVYLESVLEALDAIYGPMQSYARNRALLPAERVRLLAQNRLRELRGQMTSSSQVAAAMEARALEDARAREAAQQREIDMAQSVHAALRDAVLAEELRELQRELQRGGNWRDRLSARRSTLTPELTADALLIAKWTKGHRELQFNFGAANALLAQRHGGDPRRMLRLLGGVVTTFFGPGRALQERAARSAQPSEMLLDRIEQASERAHIARIETLATAAEDGVLMQHAASATDDDVIRVDTRGPRPTVSLRFDMLHRMIERTSNPALLAAIERLMFGMFPSLAPAKPDAVDAKPSQKVYAQLLARRHALAHTHTAERMTVDAVRTLLASEQGNDFETLKDAQRRLDAVRSTWGRAEREAYQAVLQRMRDVRGRTTEGAPASAAPAPVAEPVETPKVDAD